MTSDLDQARQAALAYYEEFSAKLSAAHRDSQDPSIFVFENYLKWKGLPSEGTLLRSEDEQRDLSPLFSIVGYPLTAQITSYGTLGASFTPIPHSAQSLDDPRGVRHEYLFHTPPDMLTLASDLLLMIAQFPFLHQIEIGPGFVLPVGEPVVEGSSMEYLYFTYPYIDDAKIYSDAPWGQIERADVLIQTLWIFPIYYSEVQYLRRNGLDAFEQLCSAKHQQQYDGYDFSRLPYV